MSWSFFELGDTFLNKGREEGFWVKLLLNLVRR
jgi:hypothetical protein